MHGRGRAGILLVVSSLLVAGLAAALASPRQAPLPTAFAPQSLEPAEGTSVLNNYTTFVRSGLVLPLGTGLDWDNYEVGGPSVLIDDGVYKMWYFGCAYGPGCKIGYATSPDGRSWTKQGVVLSPNLTAEGLQVEYPSVLKVGVQFWMWYNGWDGATWTVLAAVSDNGVNWTKRGVVMGPGPFGSNDAFAALIPHVLYDGNTFRMYYTGRPYNIDQGDQILLATSSDGTSWTKQGLVLGTGSPEARDSLSAQAASVARTGSSYEMVYRGEDSNGTWRLLSAVSGDGVQWQKLRVVLAPLAPDENTIALPFLIPLANGTTHLYYTARAGSYDLQIYLATAAPSNFGLPTGADSFLGVLTLILVVVVPPVAVLVGVWLIAGRRLKRAR